MISKRIKPATSATIFSVVFSVVVALILPVGYFFISYENLEGILETETEINSRLISRVISTNPELWRYESVRIEELLARRPRSGAPETRRILDSKGILIAESANTLQPPQIKVSQDVSDAGEVVGRIEICRSLLPILMTSGVLALFGLSLGLLLYRWLPFRALVKAGKQLQDTNSFLRKVMEGSTNALIVLDLDGNIQMFNRRFEALSGCGQEELLGTSLCRLFTDDDVSIVDAELGRVFRAETENVTFETVLLRRDGLELNLFCGAVPLISEEKVSGVVVSLDDITDRLKDEEERLALERHFQQVQKLESLGVLAGGIAHDFNNILTIILGYCYVIKYEVDPSSTQADYVQKIETAANRAGDLCRQMLSYAGDNELQHSVVKMNTLVADMTKMLHSGIKKNVTIELDLLEDLMIIADSSQLQQIVMNLIINAAEAIGDNNGTVRISLKKVDILTDQTVPDITGKTIRAGRYVCLEVSDNGCGMDEETRQRVFEPFYTTKFTGRGLGMSATLGIIKSHDGAIQLSSKPGEGTSFKVFLPLPYISGTDEIKSVEDERSFTKENGTILLIDDEEELRDLGPSWLKPLGFSALTAANGLEALEIYRKQGSQIDLVLLDLIMPEMGGMETYSRLREISPSVPIVFCSGCSMKEYSTDILEDNRVGFLKKPYKPDQLRNVLLEMLGGMNQSCRQVPDSGPVVTCTTDETPGNGTI